MTGADHHRCSHGVSQRKNGRRAVRQHHLLHHRLQVGDVVSKISHVPFVAVGKPPIGESLTAPIECCHRKPPRAQVAHRLEIFFDELSTALHDNHGALAARRRCPTGEAQIDPIGGLDRTGHHIVWHRVGGDGDEFHEAGKSRAAALWAYSRVVRTLNQKPKYRYKRNIFKGLYTNARTLAGPKGAPISSMRRPYGCARLGQAIRRTTACRSTMEDMPCELSILLPFIVPPSDSTGCFRCWTDLNRLQVTRPTTSSVPVKTTTASPSQSPASART